jgi:hypothetical protein
MSQQRANSFSIIELIKYVRKNAQTGRLLFLENDRISAEVYFNKGHLRHAKNKTVTGDDVVYQLLGNKTAEVRWERNAVPPEDSISRMEEVLLLGALGVLTEDDATDLRPARNEGPASGLEAPAAAPSPAPAPQTPVAAHPPVNESHLAAPPVSNPVFPAQRRVKPLSPSTAKNLGPEAPEISSEANLNQAAPLLDNAGANLTGLEQLREKLGDEVLRPPRFHHWTGLPLPFVSAFAFEPPDGLVKTAYDLLWQVNFSGFITCFLGKVEGFSLFYRGRIVHSRFATGPDCYKDTNALRRLLSQSIPTGETNSVLVYPLEPEFVHSYSALIMGEPELSGLSSQSVKINKLLNTLEQGNRTGVVQITNAEENGYIFLNAGRKLGSYYEIEEVLEESILRVYQIVSKTGSIIDVLTAPSEDKLFEYANRPRSIRELKLQIVELAEEIFGKRSNRVVQLLIQSEEQLPALKNHCNQARRVAQMFIDKSLADQFYERAMSLLQEHN